jgi:hypothetical protein
MDDKCPFCGQEMVSGQVEECFGFHYIEFYCCEFGERIVKGESVEQVRPDYEQYQRELESLLEDDA